MRISNGFLSGARIDWQNDVDPAKASTVRSGSVAQQDASNYSSAHELAQLVATVNESEEVRPGLVQEVSRRLAAGFYSTPEAAERTAATILQAAG
jgi:hypothetical protein